MKTSEDGVDLIKHFEGLRIKAYQDIAGVWTIGWGHTGKGAIPGMSIGIEEAEDLLRHDVALAESIVKMATAGMMVTQGQFDALVSFAFNLGGPKLMQSSLLKKMRAGNLAGAAEEFLKWTKATVAGKKIDVPGLVARRTAERELFLRS
jgi:lysozyme